MTEVFPRESAKIYAFPARGRFAPRNPNDTFAASNEPATYRVNRSVVSGSGWYHEEAIAADERARDNGPTSRKP